MRGAAFGGNMQKYRKYLSKYGPILVGLVLIAALLLLPTGYEDNIVYQESVICPAWVLSTDESLVVDTGLVRSGDQICELEILSGPFKGEIAEGNNGLNGSLEQDKLFEAGDKALVRVNYEGGEILNVSMIDHFRVPMELLLAALFIVLLVLFAGRTGVRALVSFAVCVLMLWKVLVPGALNGVNPIWLGLGVVLVMAAMTVSLVYGFDKRALASLAGCVLAVAVTCCMGMLFTDLFKIHGAVMSYSESLLYSGYSQLNLTRIFMASIFIGASGAVMDLAVDITSSVSEVVEKKPDITAAEAIRSGFTVGRAALSTQTTTLLLAYSGGYIALLMVFMAQGTPMETIFNLKYVAAEILHTLVGCFGLVTVAPLTAVTSGILLTRGSAALPAAESEQ